MDDPMNDDWKQEFRKVWDRGVAAWHQGRRSARTMFSPEDVAFLASIGCTAQELFDFVDDCLDYGDFDYETVLAVTEIRPPLLPRGDGRKAYGANRADEYPAREVGESGWDRLVAAPDRQGPDQTPR
jgi:hypothetical protein